MLDPLTWLQLGLSAALLSVIIERSFYLLYRAPVSNEAMRWLRESFENEDRAALLAWSAHLPRAHVARVIRAALDGDAAEERDDVEDVLADVRERRLRGLRVLRVGATLASTTGLLIGLLRLRHGFAGDHGLLALEAGLPQRMAMADALLSMGIGVATAAVCFHALALLRRAAVSLAEQTASVARRLQSEG